MTDISIGASDVKEKPVTLFHAEFANTLILCSNTYYRGKNEFAGQGTSHTIYALEWRIKP
jgi:hypothetical protein